MDPTTQDLIDRVDDLCWARKEHTPGRWATDWEP
jgi:hypothetical protein